MRASVPSAEWDEFGGGGISDGEFRVAMLLLAAAAGYPAMAREWFERLRTTAPAELFLGEDGSVGEPAWLQFKKVYNAIFAHIRTPLTRDLLIIWVDRVERFAF